MKRLSCILLALALLASLAACGKKPEAPAPAPEPPAEDFVWTREGYFKDENDNLVSIMKSEDAENPGWYVGCLMDEGMHGWYIQQEGAALHGNIIAPYEGDEAPFVVTVTEEGEDGIQFAVEGGATYHLTPYELPEAAFTATANTEGMGQIAYAEGDATPEFEEEYPSTSVYLGLESAETYTFAAKPDEGWKFKRWERNGEKFSTEPQITLEIAEDTELIAVFGVAGTDETPVDLDHVTTLGELLGLPNYGTGASETYYIYAFEQDDMIYRAFAESTPEVFDALMALEWDDPEYDAKERELVSALPVTRIENLSEGIPAQEELDALIGKTGAELIEDGWYVSGWNLEDMLFYMYKGVYGYTVTMEGEVGDPYSFEEEDINALVVTSVTCEGVEQPTAYDEE